MSEVDWADLVLQDVPAPVNATNEQNLVNWMANEEPPAQWWGGYGTPSAPTRINPLNTGLGSGGGSGLGSFPDLTTAAHYTAATIDQSNMAPIKSALESSAAPAEFGQAVISTPWASSHYGGDVSRFTSPHSPGPDVTNPSAAGVAQTEPAGQPVAASTSPAALTGFLGIPTPGEIKGIVFESLFIAGGVVLVVLGTFKIANPGGLRQVVQRAETAGSIAAL